MALAGKYLGYVLIGLILALSGYLVWQLCYFAYRAGPHLSKQFFDLEASTSVPLAFTLLTAAFGLGATLFTQARARKRAIEEAHRDKKVKLYHRLLSLLTEFQLAAKPEFDDVKIGDKDVIQRMADFRTELSLWASPAVLNTFYDLTHTSPGDGPLAVLDKIDPLIIAIRKDIGLSSAGLPEKFFIRSMLTNPDELP